MMGRPAPEDERARLVTDHPEVQTASQRRSAAPGGAGGMTPDHPSGQTSRAAWSRAILACPRPRFWLPIMREGLHSAYRGFPVARGQ
jgi:hypothetical protein